MRDYDLNSEDEDEDERLFLPRHSRTGVASVESLVTRLFNARVKPTRLLGI